MSCSIFYIKGLKSAFTLIFNAKKPSKNEFVVHEIILFSWCLVFFTVTDNLNWTFRKCFEQVV